MKNTRKILTMLLLLAMLVACFSIVSFADDSAEGGAAAAPEVDYKKLYADAVEKHERVLEYYESEVYLNASFNDGVDFDEAVASDSDEFFVKKGGAFSSVSSEDGTITVSSVNATTFNIKQNAPAAFGINFRAKVSSGKSISVYVANSTGNALKVFSVSPGKITAEYDTENKVYTSISSEVKDGVYFDVQFFLMKDSGKDVITVNVTPSNTNKTETVTYSYANDTTDTLSGKFKFDNAYLSVENSATFDYIEMYQGSFSRSLSANNDAAIGNALIAAYADYVAYKDKVADGAVELATIIAKVVIDYDFDYANYEEVKSAALQAISSYFDICVSECKKGYEIIQSGASGEDVVNKAYNDRLAVIEAVDSAYGFVVGVKDGEFASIYEDALKDQPQISDYLSAIAAEKAALEDIKDKTSMAVSSALAVESIYLAKYDVYEALFDIFANNPIDETYYDDEITVDDVLAALEVKKVVEREYGVMKSTAEAFVSGVIIAANKNVSFAERYSAYSIAKENLFTDSTYNKNLNNTTIEALVETYETVDAEMKQISAYAEEFLAKISEADRIPSYTAKQVALDAAEAYIDGVEKEYPGVAAAIERYDYWRKEIVVRFEVAEKYIRSVMNVMRAETVRDKKAAIVIAESYAALGSDVSIDIVIMEYTVTQANEILSIEKSKIALEEIRIANYVAAVAEIPSKTDVLERRSIINKAIALKDSTNPEEEQVVEASKLLDIYISAYNAEVEAANSAAENETAVVLSVLAKTTPTKRVAEIVAIIKKFYEE